MESGLVRTLAAIGIGIAIGFVVYKLATSPAETGKATETQTAGPTATEKPSAKQTAKPTARPTTTNTPAPTARPTVTPRPAPVKTLEYALPDGFRTIKDKTGTFETGYDPIMYRPGNTKTGVELWEIIQGSYQTPDWIVINVYPYDGGSRHQFFYDIWGSVPTNSEMGTEENLAYDNKSCLALHRVHVSQWNPEWVMCDIGRNRALVVSSRIPQTLTTTLKTIRILK